MAIDLFRLNPLARTLQLVSVLPMDSLKFSEANDLEAWLSSCSARLFGREILWIARQDRATHDQRSDIVGVAKDGDLLIAELKKGLLEESAVRQALGYSAEYHEKTADDWRTSSILRAPRAEVPVWLSRPIPLSTRRKDLRII